METMFRQLRVKPNVYANVTGHEAVVAMVALGFAVGGVPEIVAASSPYQNQVQFIESPIDHQPFNIGLICHKRHKQNAIVSAFWAVAESMS